jgi:hypothetical protein
MPISEKKIYICDCCEKEVASESIPDKWLGFQQRVTVLQGKDGGYMEFCVIMDTPHRMFCSKECLIKYFAKMIKESRFVTDEELEE